MEIQIQHFKNKNKKRNYNTINNYHTFNPQKYDNLQHYVFQHNHTNTYPKYLNKTKVEESNNTKNYSDYEAMWEIAIDKWTRNLNVKYYKQNKISTCKFKPLDLDMTKNRSTINIKSTGSRNKSIRSCRNN